MVIVSYDCNLDINVIVRPNLELFGLLFHLGLLFLEELILKGAAQLSTFFSGGTRNYTNRRPERAQLTIIPN